MKNILVIYGGNSLERDVSIITAVQAMKNIDKTKYRVFPLYLYDDLYYVTNPENLKQYTSIGNSFSKAQIAKKSLYIEKFKVLIKLANIDCALLCTHGGCGEDGSLQGLLEIMQIPYTSSNVKVSNIGMHKSLTKLFLRRIGVKALRFTTLKNTDNVEELVNKLDYPVIVKPNSLGSSIGISVANNKLEMLDSLKVAYNLDSEVIIEKALKSFRELNVACYLDNKTVVVSNIEEPVGWKSFLSFEDKYINNIGSKVSRQYPAMIPKIIEDKIKWTAKKVYASLGAKGVIRFDFMLDNDSGILYLNEFNTIPGSLAYYLFEGMGITYKDLLTNWIEESISTSKSDLLLYNSNVLDNYNKLGYKNKNLKSNKV